MRDRQGSARWWPRWLPPGNAFKKQSRKRRHHVLGVGGPRLQPLVPSLHILELRPLDRERVPAMDEAADGDIAHREVLARDIELAFELLVEPRPDLAGVDGRLGDRRHVAL